MVRINFGKYEGWDTKDVPTDWLEWHLADCERKAKDYREELERRREAASIDDTELFPTLKEAVAKPDGQISYKVDEAARITGFSTTTLYQEIREGRLLAIKIGRRQVIQREDLLDWMKRMKNADRV